MNVVTYTQKRQYGQSTRHKVGNIKHVEELLEKKFTESFVNKACSVSGTCRATFVMAFSPDGTKVASSHGDHTVRVTDIETGKCDHTLTGHPRTTWCLAFHPSSNHILASGCLGGQIRIWDLYGHGCEVWNTENGTVIASLTFHPIDHVLVIASANTLYFWDWSRREPFAKCSTAHEFERIRWVQFDSNGHHLYTGISNNVSVDREQVAEASFQRQERWVPTNVPTSVPTRLGPLYGNIVSCFQEYSRDRLLNQSAPYPCVNRSTGAAGSSEVHAGENRAPHSQVSVQRGYRNINLQNSQSSSSNEHQNEPRNLKPRVGHNAEMGHLTQIERSAPWSWQTNYNRRSSSFNTHITRGSHGNRNSPAGLNPEDVLLSSVSDPLLSSAAEESTNITDNPNEDINSANAINDLNLGLYQQNRRLHQGSRSSWSPLAELGLPVIGNVEETEISLESITRNAPLLLGNELLNSFTGNVSGNTTGEHDGQQASSSSDPVHQVSSSQSNCGSATSEPVNQSSTVPTTSAASLNKCQHLQSLHLLPKSLLPKMHSHTPQFTSIRERLKSLLPPSVDAKKGSNMRLNAISNNRDIPKVIVLKGTPDIGSANNNSEFPQSHSFHPNNFQSEMSLNSHQSLSANMNSLGELGAVSDRTGYLVTRENLPHNSSMAWNPDVGHTSNTNEQESYSTFLQNRQGNNDRNNRTLNDRTGDVPHIPNILDSHLLNLRRQPDKISMHGHPYLESRGIRTPVKDCSSVSRTTPSSSCHREQTLPYCDSHNNRDQTNQTMSKVHSLEQENVTGSAVSVSPHLHSREPDTSSTESEGNTRMNSYESGFMQFNNDTISAQSSSPVHFNTATSCSDNFHQGSTSTGVTGQGEGFVSHLTSALPGTDNQEIELMVDHNENYTTHTENNSNPSSSLNEIRLQDQDNNNNSIHIVTVSRPGVIASMTEASERRSQDYVRLRDSFVSITDQIEREMSELNRRISALRETFNESIQTLRHDRRMYENLNIALPSETATNLAPLTPPLPGRIGHFGMQDGVLLASETSNHHNDVINRVLGTEDQLSESIPITQPPTLLETSLRSHTRGRQILNSLPSRSREQIGLQQMQDDAHHWHMLQHHYLHPHYSTTILDETINRPPNVLQDAINRAIAGTLVGMDEAAVATNIINQTHRIQFWDFTKCDIPDISNCNHNIVVSHCKLHNGASVDLSQNDSLLATFVPSHQAFPDGNILAVFSLLPATRGQCLYTKRFGPNAVSISISPTNNYVLVGLTAKRLTWVFTSDQLVAQIFKLQKQGAGESSMKHIKDVMHQSRPEVRTQVSGNSARWLPYPGQGLVYGTNRGDLHICQPSVKVIVDKSDGTPVDETTLPQDSNFSFISRYAEMVPNPIRSRLRRVNTSTQTANSRLPTGALNLRLSAGTQTEVDQHGPINLLSSTSTFSE